jgi:hypothetical protein
MSISNLQNRTITIGTPVEVESAVNDIRTVLMNLPWIDRPYFIAQRFFKTENGRSFIYPETYAPDKPGSRNYQRVTPDNDYLGSFFFLVGSGKQKEFSANQYNYLNYPVSIIFSVNLDLIDKAKLNDGLFTQELIRDARRLLTTTMTNHEFEYTLQSETRDVREVYKEFSMNEIEKFNTAPMQCFRIDLLLTLQEDCN